MPIPTQDPSDNFYAAAQRHFDDAVFLEQQGRSDNAIYLAGYVQECALKAYLEGSLAQLNARDFSHNIESLGQAAQCFSSAMSIRSPRHLSQALQAGAVLDHGHPHRRYWPDLWQPQDAEDAIAQAKTLLDDLLWAPVLDRGGPLP